MSKCHYCFDRRRPKEVKVFNVKINKKPLKELKNLIKSWEEGELNYSWDYLAEDRSKFTSTLKIVPIDGRRNDFTIKLIRTIVRDA